MRPSHVIAIGVALVVLLGAAWRLGWLATGQADKPAPLTIPVAEAPAPQASAAASVPAVRHPIEAVAADAVAAAATGAPQPAAAPKDLVASLAGLFGERVVLTMFQTDGFAARVVATVDNLGRAQAPARLWPVNPTPGRFTTQALGDGEVIAAANAERYAPFLRMVESVPARQVVALYRRHYAEFQRAYEELGYPGRQFNDRLVEVIDVLLSTPEHAGPMKVLLPTIAGPMPPVRPWVLYAFADRAYEPLAAGQALLLRMGTANERRLKARLLEIRALVASGDRPR